MVSSNEEKENATEILMTHFGWPKHVALQELDLALATSSWKPEDVAMEIIRVNPVHSPKVA